MLVSNNPNFSKIILCWDVCNKSQSHWESCNLILKLQNNPCGVQIVIDPMYIEKGVKPSRIETLEITLNIPKSLLDEIIVLDFKFETSKRELIGD